MSSIKIERLNHAIQEEISMIIMKEVKDENIKFVTITGVDTTSDLSYAKVYYNETLVKTDLEGKPRKLDTSVLGEHEIVYFLK